PLPERSELAAGGRAGDAAVLADLRQDQAGSGAGQATGVPAEAGGRPQAGAGEAAGAQAEGVTAETWTPRGGRETRVNISDSVVEGSAGAISFEVRRDAEDRTPLQLWVTRD